MNNELVIKLKRTYLYDILKPEIDPFERCEIIKSIMADEGLTHNKFAEKYGIPKATLSNWLVFTPDKKEEYIEKQNQGVSKTELYRGMRHGTPGIKVQKKSNTWILEAIKHVRHLRKTAETDRYTVGDLEKLIDEINQWIVDINLKEKRNNR